MEISRDVILDLLTLVEAGEASAESRALVEAHLARDPELARIARARVPKLSELGTPAPLAREVEMKSLERAKRLVNWRSVLLALAVFFAVFPVTYSANSRSWHWDLIESPLGAALSAVLAAVCWGAFLAIRHALRARRA